MAGPPWRLLSLAPATPDRVRGWFAGIDRLMTDFPAERSAAAVRSAEAATAQAIGRIFGLVGDNVRQAIAGEQITSVVNGLDPIIRRRSAP